MSSESLLKYKTTFRGLTLCPIEQNHCRACLNISVDNENLQGSKLIAIVNKATRVFASLDIMICDSLNRFNIMLEKNIDSLLAEKLSLEIGNEWIKKNLDPIRELAIPIRVLRWNEWRQKPEYSMVHTQLVKLFNEDDDCKSIFIESSQKYLERKKLVGLEHAEQRSLEYLIEECSVIRLWALYGYNLELYPSDRSPVVSCMFDKLINSTDNYLYFSRIDLRREYATSA